MISCSPKRGAEIRLHWSIWSNTCLHQPRNSVVFSTPWSREKVIRQQILRWKKWNCQIICWSWSNEISLPLPGYFQISRRSWKDFNIDNIKRELQDWELCYRTATDCTAIEGKESDDTLVERFNTVMCNLRDKTAPVTEMTVQERHDQPWLDAEFRCTWRVVR